MTNVKCVFVLDDDPSARKGLARLLRTAGHEVCAFASANEFLEALGTEVCGCLVLDARMPGPSGIDLPIIVISADDDSETRAQAKKLNAEGFFRKPVDATALLDAIDWAMR